MPRLLKIAEEKRIQITNKQAKNKIKPDENYSFKTARNHRF